MIYRTDVGKRDCGVAAKSDVRDLEYTLVAIALFSAWAVASSDPSGFGPTLVGGVAYFSAICLLFFGLGMTRERLPYILMIVIGTAAVLLAAYSLTGGNGSPVHGNQISTSCYNVQIPNSTSPSGFTNASKCTNTPYYNDTSVLYNVAFWTPLIGALVYAMPSWIQAGQRNTASSISRILKGSVPAGAMLLLTFGLYNLSGGYPELFNGHSPLNPYVSFNPLCDSTDFGVISCVKVNLPAYFIDYAFWIAIVALIAIALGRLSDAAKTIRRPQGEAIMAGMGFA